MFRRLFEQYMRAEPETVDQKYIFIVDNSDLALSIADAGFQTVALEEENPNLFLEHYGECCSCAHRVVFALFGWLGEDKPLVSCKY